LFAALGPITSVFALIALGYALARLRVLDRAGVGGLSAFVFYVAIPALLFGSIARGVVASGAEIDVAFAYFLAALVFFGASILLARLAFRAGLAAGAVFALNTTFGNTVILGIPLLLQLYGPGAATAVFCIVGFHSLTLIPVATALIELGMAEDAHPLRVAGKAVLALVRNPIIVSLVAGIAWGMGGLALPGTVDQIIKMLSGAAGPCALFALGASLAGYDATADLPQAVAVSVLKLVGMPAFVWLAATYLFHLPPLETRVAVTMAALPTGANAFILAAKYRMFERSSAATVVLSTAASYLTMLALGALFAG
jgi:malonate transporter